MISAGIRSFFEQVKLTEVISKENVNERIPCAFTPSRAELTRIVEEAVAKKLLETKMDILKENMLFYLALDKGNKRGISHFVKYNCF